MDAQFNTNVYHFTEEVMTLLLQKFEGKTVGGEDMNKELIMKEFFGDFKPGDKVVQHEDDGGGEKKSASKKKGKKKKDPSEPKRPTTAFFYYTASVREDIKKKNPGKSVGELSKIFGQMWADLPDEEKEPFNNMNVKHKERYAKEKEEWNKKKQGPVP